MSDLEHTEPKPRLAPPEAAARRRATLPPPIPPAARASGAIATGRPPIPQRPSGAMATVTPPTRATSASATVPPPIPQRATRATGTVPPPIPQRVTSAMATVQPQIAQRVTGAMATVQPPIPREPFLATGTVPPPIPQRVTGAIATVQPPIPREPFLATGTVPPPNPRVTRPITTTVPPPIPQRATRATKTVPPPIPDQVRAKASASQPVQPDPSADFDIDIEMDVDAAPARAAAPLPRLERNADIAWVEPDDERHAYLARTDGFEHRAHVEPSHAFERDAYGSSTEDVERAPRPFPLFKLAIAAVLVSGLSAVITLKVIGAGDLAAVSTENVSSASISPQTTGTVQMQAAPTAAPVVEPITTVPEAQPAIAASEPVAQPGVQPVAPAIAAPEPAATPTTSPAPAAQQPFPGAEPVARQSGRRGKRARSVAAASTQSSAQGTLMISTKPPCEIAIDGVATMLTTPQRAIKLRTGKHKVTLFNDSLKIQATYVVKIEAGKPTKLLRDLMPK
jgi:hypothetical protein